MFQGATESVFYVYLKRIVKKIWEFLSLKMARNIINKLFQDQKALFPEDQFVSMKDWKELVSRLDHIQVQTESNQEKMNLLYSKVTQWLNRAREKIDAVSKAQREMDLTVKDMFKTWEEKLLNWVQPEQRKEDQKRIMSLMSRHSQFIQSYNQQIDAVKNALSKNEYQVYQLLEQMRSIRAEMGLLSRKGSLKTKAPTADFNKESSPHFDLFS